MKITLVSFSIGAYGFRITFTIFFSRADCVTTLRKSCTSEFKNHTVLDTTIWRYREPLVKAVTNTLVKLGFFRTPQSTHALMPSAAVRRK